MGEKDGRMSKQRGRRCKKERQINFTLIESSYFRKVDADADIKYYKISLIFTLPLCSLQFLLFYIAFKSGHVLTSLGTSDFSK